MLPSYEPLLGRKFIHGTQDCYTFLQDFYRLTFGIELCNYARPDNWWDKGLDLYREHFRDEGFYVLDCHPSQYQYGDVALCAVLSTTVNHAAIFVEPGYVVHHLPRQPSTRREYRGLVRNSTCMVIRHKDAKLPTTGTMIDVRDYLPARVRQEIAAAEAVRDNRESGSDPE